MDNVSTTLKLDEEIEDDDWIIFNIQETGKIIYVNLLIPMVKR